MAQDSLENTKKTCSYEPSFPLFNLDLLKQGDFEADISNLIPFEKVCEAIQAKNLHKIDLNGDFSLFKPKPKKKSTKASLKKEASQCRGKNAKGGAHPISMPQNKSYITVKRVKTETKFEAFEQKIASKQLWHQNSPWGNKKAADSQKENEEKPYNFPSLASILGEDEGELSDEDARFERDSAKSKTTVDDMNGKHTSGLKIDFNEQRNYDGNLLSNGHSIFNKAFKVIDCEVPLFRSLFSPQEGDPHRISGNFEAFNLYDNLARNSKLSPFDLMMQDDEEDKTSSSFNSQIEINLEESSNLGLNSNVVLTK